MNNKNKQNVLLEKADELARIIYKFTKKFPKSELFGITSQLRRATISIPLNVIEGFARYSLGDHCRFLEIAYGSLKESKYLIYFAYREEYLDKKEYEELIQLAEEIGKMLWTKIQTLRKQQVNQ